MSKRFEILARCNDAQQPRQGSYNHYDYKPFVKGLALFNNHLDYLPIKK